MFDLNVSERQQIGSWWQPQASDSRDAKELLEGKLTLAPHPKWSIPTGAFWNDDPFGQRNWRFQLHCLKWLEPLRRVARTDNDLSGDCRTLWLNTVRSWSSQHLLGDDEYAWMDMADGVRAIELVLGAPLVPEGNIGEHAEIIRVHANRLSDKSRRGIGNHALHQLQGLYVAACFLQDSELKSEAREQIRGLFEENYDREGINAEGSISYHDLNYHWWTTAMARLSVEGDSMPEAESTLTKSRVAISHFVRPDGHLEMIGDTPEGRDLTNDGRSETLFVRTQGREGSTPASRAGVFSGGYVAGRSGWGSPERPFEDETFYTVRFGSEGAVHGHSDGSSFTIFAAGRPWIVDPGMYAYQRDRYRRYFLSRDAHNVITPTSARGSVNTETKLVSWGQGDHLDHYLISSQPHAGYELLRYFLFVRKLNSFIIYDTVKRADDSEPAIGFSQLWHFHPDCEVGLGLRSAALSWGGKSARVRWALRPPLEIVSGQEEPMQGWYSPSYGKAVASPVVMAKSASHYPYSWLAAVSFDDTDVVPVGVSESRGETHITIECDESAFRIELSSGTEPSFWEKL